MSKKRKIKKFVKHEVAPKKLYKRAKSEEVWLDELEEDEKHGHHKELEPRE